MTATRKRTTKAPARRRATAAANASTAVVEGADQLVDALDTEIRVRVSASVVVAVLLVVVLLILTAAASVNWLYAIVTIALAFAAGWLSCRSTHA